MRIFSLAVTLVWVFTGVVAQTPTITSCPSIISTTLTSPAASCTITACAACSNGNYISTYTSAHSSALSIATSRLSSTLNAVPASSSVVVSQLSSYGSVLGNYGNNFLADRTCLSITDISGILERLAAAVDQLDSVLETASAGIQEVIGIANYQNQAVSLIKSLREHILDNFYALWISQGCVDWNKVVSVNDKIDSFSAKYPTLAFENGSPILRHLESPCRNVLSYTTEYGTCGPSLCRASPVASSICASCQVAPASTSALQDNLSSAALKVTGAATYATATPFKQTSFSGSFGLKATHDALALMALRYIQQESKCVNNDQAHTIITSLTNYVNSMAWGLAQSGNMEYAAGGPRFFLNFLGVIPRDTIRSLAQTLQLILSNPSSCYDCNDALRFNSAIINFYDRFIEYVAYRGLSTDPGEKPLLVIECTTACASSSVSSLISSTILPSSESSLASSGSATVEPSATSLQITEVSSDSTAASSNEMTQASSASYELSSSLPPAPMSASVASFSIESTAASSENTVASSVATTASSNEPTQVSSASCESSQSVSQTSAGFDSSIGSVVFTSSSVESLDSSATFVLSSFAASFTSTLSHGDSESLSMSSGSLPATESQQSGYFNTTSADSAVSLWISPSSVQTPLPPTSKPSEKTEDIYSSVHTFTGASVVETCATCTDNHATFTKTPESTKSTSAETFTETAATTERCLTCPGGSATLTSIYHTGKSTLSKPFTTIVTGTPTTYTTVKTELPTVFTTTGVVYSTTMSIATAAPPASTGMLRTNTITEGCPKCPASTTIYPSSMAVSGTSSYPATDNSASAVVSLWTSGSLTLSTISPTSVVEANHASKKHWEPSFLVVPVFLALF